MIDIKQPKHYTSHPSGIECKQITLQLSCGLANAVKYVWRSSSKHDNPRKDICKAIEYLQYEIDELLKFSPKGRTRRLCQSYAQGCVTQSLNQVASAETTPRLKRFYEHITGAIAAQTTSMQLVHIQDAIGLLNFYL